MQINELLKLTVDRGSSDLYLKVPSSPRFRIDSMLIPQEDLPVATSQDIGAVFKQVITQKQRPYFVENENWILLTVFPG